MKALLISVVLGLALLMLVGPGWAGKLETGTGAGADVVWVYSGPKVADAQIKATPGVLHTIVCNSDAAATAGSVDVYDNTAESGTKIHSITFGTGFYPPTTMTFDVAFTIGLYLGFTTTGDVTCSVSYR